MRPRYTDPPDVLWPVRCAIGLAVIVAPVVMTAMLVTLRAADWMTGRMT